MGRHTCEQGHTWKSRFNPHPSEMHCPECGGYPQPTLKTKTGGFGLGGAESSVLAEAHERFSRLVTESPCWAASERPGHICWGPKDPHHLVPASWVKSVFGDLPDEHLAEILYAPVIGCPACRKFHEALENRSEIILLHELDDEVRLFCERVDRDYPGRPSMLARLEIESPPLTPEHSHVA